MFGFCPLASGSKGNSIYFGSKKTKILIDAGLTFSQLQNRLNEIGVAINEIDAILITHEHSDHIAGLKVITEKVNIPIFANSDTAKSIYNHHHILPKFKIFVTGEEFEFKDLVILPFSISHDTFDPVGYVIKTNNIKCGFCTDFGFVSSLIKKALKECDYLYVEANHQISMVEASNRSYVYKQRVVSRQGHLSNADCLKLLDEILHPFLKHIHIAHISSECYSRKLLKDILSDFLKKKNSKTEFSLTNQDIISKNIYF